MNDSTVQNRIPKTEEEAIFGVPVLLDPVYNEIAAVEGPNYRPVSERDLREYERTHGRGGKSTDAILKAVDAALAGKRVLLATGRGLLKIELERPTVQQVQDMEPVVIEAGK